jgi:hypothetical protein
VSDRVYFLETHLRYVCNWCLGVVLAKMITFQSVCNWCLGVVFAKMITFQRCIVAT